MIASTILFLSFLSIWAYAKVCLNIMIPVYIEAQQAIFDQVPITDNTLATTFALNFTSTRNGGNYTATIVRGFQTVTGQYQISGQFCRPNQGIPATPTMQLLVHGIGFDKTYWDLPYDSYSYSYANTAVDLYNFCTLAIDRFGIAGSSHADPLNVVQAPATMSSIYKITQMLRAGTLPGVPTKFSKVVHVGHSFGSFLSYFLVTRYPDASDGLILTGFSFSGTWFKQTIAGWNLHLASLNQPFRFGSAVPPRRTLLTAIFGGIFSSKALANIVSYIADSISGASISSDVIFQDVTTTEFADTLTGYNATMPAPQYLPASYLTWSDLTANIFAFLYPSAYDPAFALLAEKTKQPVTVGELFTIGNAPASAPGYSGPVLIITGAQDNIYCGGDCIGATAGTAYSSVPAAGIAAFPAASEFEAYIQPNMGHGMNFHYNATGYYDVVQEFLIKHGLGSG